MCEAFRKYTPDPETTYKYSRYEHEWLNLPDYKGGQIILRQNIIDTWTSADGNIWQKHSPYGT